MIKGSIFNRYFLSKSLSYIPVHFILYEDVIVDNLGTYFGDYIYIPYILDMN